MPLSSRRAHSTLGAAWIAQLLVLTLFGGAAPQPHAEVTTVSVESPNKVLQVSLDVDGGTPYYRVQRLGEAVCNARGWASSYATAGWTAAWSYLHRHVKVTTTPGSSPGAKRGWCAITTTNCA